MLLIHASLAFASMMPLSPRGPVSAPLQGGSGSSTTNGGIVCGHPDTVLPGRQPVSAPEKFGGPAAPGEAAPLPGGGQCGLGQSPGTPGPAPGPITVGPAVSTYDPLRWNAWWRLERDGFLKVRESVRRRYVLGTEGLSAIARADVPPSRFMVESQVVPALIEVLSRETNPEMQRSALIALARTGVRVGAAGQGLLPLEVESTLIRHLASSSQEVSETAALALGILGGKSCFTVLEQLLMGGDVGAALVGRGQVPSRTQAFAAFGMGALAFDAQGVALSQRAAATLVETLGRQHSVSDVPVAAMLALGQCQLPKKVSQPSPLIRRASAREAITSSTGMLRWLLARLDRGPSRTRVSSSQEHAFCLVAVSHFAQDAEESIRGEVLDRLRAEARNRRLAHQVRSAAVIAIGELARSSGSQADRAALQLLTEFMDSGQPFERRMATMALAQASSQAGPRDDPFGSSDLAARTLHRTLLRGGSTERPWGALALGVQAFYMDQAAGTARVASAKEVQCRAEMRRALAKHKNISSIGAYALGTALMHKGARPEAREIAGEIIFGAYDRVGEPEAKGHLALALGLVGYAPAKDALLSDVTDFVSQPSLLWHTAVGLGLIGDDRLAPRLIEALIKAPSHESRAAIAVALGTIGDRRAVEPLLELVADESQPTASRSMAIVGVGVLCEDTELPWRNPMAHALPYAAMTDTLGGQGNPIFDIL